MLSGAARESESNDITVRKPEATAGALAKAKADEAVGAKASNDVRASTAARSKNAALQATDTTK